MASKFPQPASSPRPRKPPVPYAPAPGPKSSGTNPAPVSPQASELFRKRRTGIWAVGVAIIVASGSILGAQLKGTQQEREALPPVQADKIPTSLSSGADVDTARVSAASLKSRDDNGRVQENQARNLQSSTAQTSGNQSSAAGGRGTSITQRQIAHLEDRRGVLMSQKLDLEAKIERVRDKIRKEEAMATRRKEPEVTPGR